MEKIILEVLITRSPLHEGSQFVDQYLLSFCQLIGVHFLVVKLLFIFAVVAVQHCVVLQHLLAGLMVAGRVQMSQRPAKNETGLFEAAREFVCTQQHYNKADVIVLVATCQAGTGCHCYSRFYSHKPFPSQQFVRVFPDNFLFDAIICDPNRVLNCADDLEKERNIKTGSNQQRQIIGIGRVSKIRQSMRITKVGLPHQQLFSVFVHLYEKSVEYGLFRVIVDESTSPFGQTDSCIVTTGQHQSIEQLFDGKQISNHQLGSCTCHLAGLLVYCGHFGTQINFSFLGNSVDGIKGHYLRETSDFGVVLEAVASDDAHGGVLDDYKAFGFDLSEFFLIEVEDRFITPFVWTYVTN